jgi:acyl-CoA thioesterase II
MRAPIDDLLDLLDLKTLDDNHFRGFSPDVTGPMIYGGQVAAQALVAAQRTVPGDRPAHSLHAYFVLAGDPRAPIEFNVENIRDGKSFATRRCVASQAGRTIFSLEASFHTPEDGFDHTTPATPIAPDPETLETSDALAERFRDALPAVIAKRIARETALDVRVVDPDRYLLTDGPVAPRQCIWFRAKGKMSDDGALHRAVLAYFSDMSLINTALIGHGRLIFQPDIQAASLDHAVWFHRPFRADDWLLYEQESPTAFGGRTLTRGQIFTQDGRLVASIVQEGLARIRRERR